MAALGFGRTELTLPTFQAWNSGLRPAYQWGKCSSRAKNGDKNGGNGHMEVEGETMTSPQIRVFTIKNNPKNAMLYGQLSPVYR